LKILGIDDNVDITDLLDMVLNVDHEFQFTNSGREGVKLIQENKFDVVLLDLSMPDFTGIDVMDELKKNGLLDKQKIVLFTASSMTDSEIDGILKQGAHSCIRKPIDTDLLLEKLEKLT